MTMQKNDYQSIDRLAALIRILSDEWEEPAWFMGQLDYPSNDDSARRAFRRDIAALREFGFLIEEKRESNKPSYRLTGHKKWPHAASMERVMRPTMPGNVRQG
jgi:acetylornithine deacetylase/succinyl-diaminopimelate desuccinylase-like protein